jgi:hypothetical protein
VTSEEALALAIEQVNKLATNERGYQNGITLPQKIDAVERLAAVLMGEAEGAEGVELVFTREIGEAAQIDYAEYWPRAGDQLDQCLLCGAITEGTSTHTDWHRGLGR